MRTSSWLIVLMQPNCFTLAEQASPYISVAGLDLVVGHETIRSGVSFEVRKGQIVRIQGANGAGKTTLLRTIIRTAPGGSGCVCFHVPFELGRSAAYVPQNANETLLPWLSCWENVLLGLSRACTVGLGGGFVELARRFLGLPQATGGMVHELRGYKQHVDISELSGGERQKLALLRGLICAPGILLLDEPFNELDREGVAALIGFLKSFVVNGAVLLVTHQEVELAYSSEVKL